MAKEKVLSGEDKGKTVDTVALSVSEVKELYAGSRVKIHTSYSQHGIGLVNVKINGKPKVWKTRPNDVSVPVKYGLYECATIDYRDGEPSDSGLYFVRVKQ